MVDGKFKQMIDLKKKSGKKLSEPHMKARGDVLEDLLGQVDGIGADRIKGLKKVTVASNSPEGLEKGLSKAKEMVANKDEMEPIEGESLEERESDDAISDSEHEDEMESEQESPEELEQQIAELKAKLDALRG